MNNFDDFQSFHKYLKNFNKGQFDKNMKIKFEVDPTLLKTMMLVIWYLLQEYELDLYENLEKSPSPQHFWKGCQKIIENSSRKDNVPNTSRVILDYLYDHNLYDRNGEEL